MTYNIYIETVDPCKEWCEDYPLVTDDKELMTESLRWDKSSVGKYGFASMSW